MDRYLFRKITFAQLYRLPEEDLPKFNKKQVLQLCITEIDRSFDRVLVVLGFIGTRYIQYLNDKERNYILTLLYREICGFLAEVTPEPYHLEDIINLTTVAMLNAGQPPEQVVYKDLYAAISPLILESFKLANRSALPKSEDEYLASENLLMEFLTFIRSRKFNIHSSEEDKDLFEQILVSILDIAQVLLHFNVHSLNVTLITFFNLIAEHQWDADIQGPLYSSNKECFQFISKFLTESAKMDYSSFHEKWQKLHLFYSAILKLYRLGRAPYILLECQPSDLISLYGEFERAIKTIPPERETNISSLKGIHLQLICMIPTERLIPAIQDSSKEAAYKFCLMFLDQCNLRQLDMNWHGTNLMTSIFVALQKERLVSSKTEFSNIVIRVNMIMIDTMATDPPLFAKLLRCIVGLMFQVTTIMCPALKFIFLIQDALLLLLTPASLLTAFQFYQAMAAELSVESFSPARWAFESLARTSYSFLSSRHQKMVRAELPRSTLDTLIPIDRSRTNAIIAELPGIVTQFLQQQNNFSQMQATLYALDRSIHTLNPSTVDQLNRHFDVLWSFIVAYRHNWGQLQFMGPFLAILIRLSARVKINLPEHLTPILDMTLPQSTTAMILLSLCDAILNRHATPAYLPAFTEQVVRKCYNIPVKSFVLSSLSQAAANSPLTTRLLEGTELTINTTFPHNCCERTCCFVLANSSPGRMHPIDHSPIICSLKHAIEQLEKKETVASWEAMDMERLSKMFSKMLVDRKSN